RRRRIVCVRARRGAALAAGHAHPLPPGGLKAGLRFGYGPAMSDTDSSGIVGSAGVINAAGVVGSAGVVGAAGVIGSAGVVGASGVFGSVGGGGSSAGGGRAG